MSRWWNESVCCKWHKCNQNINDASIERQAWLLSELHSAPSAASIRSAISLHIMHKFRITCGDAANHSSRYPLSKCKHSVCLQERQMRIVSLWMENAGSTANHETCTTFEWFYAISRRGDVVWERINRVITMCRRKVQRVDNEHSKCSAPDDVCRCSFSRDIFALTSSECS